jgi:hypothetical protein
MDLALCIDKLIPAAQYRGSVTANTREAYCSLVWEDSRPKPTWGDILAAWDAVQVDMENDATKKSLAETDLKMPRALEDFIDTAVAETGFSFATLPKETRDIHALKKTLRGSLK